MMGGYARDMIIAWTLVIVVVGLLVGIGYCAYAHDRDRDAKCEPCEAQYGSMKLQDVPARCSECFVDVPQTTVVVAPVVVGR